MNTSYHNYKTNVITLSKDRILYYLLSAEIISVKVYFVQLLPNCVSSIQLLFKEK